MLPDINLLPKYERRSSLLYYLFICGIIVWILLLSFIIYQFINEKSQLKEVEIEKTELTAIKESLERRLLQLESSGVGGLEEMIGHVEKHTIPTSPFIDRLMTLLPEQGNLVEYSYTEGAVEIDTQFETMSDASEYVAALNASDHIRDIKIDKVETFELGAPQETEAQEDENGETYTVIPRYHITYSIDVNRTNLMKEANEDE